MGPFFFLQKTLPSLGKSSNISAKPTTKQMSNETKAVVVKQEQSIEFVPFGAREKIKMNCQIVRNLIAVPTKGGDLPGDRDCMRFMMLCRSRQLDPFVGDAYLLGFNNREKGIVEWSLITAHQSFLKRAEPHGEFNGKKSGVIFSPPAECRVCDGDGYVDQKGEKAKCPKCDGKGHWDELEGDFMPQTIQGEKIELAGGWCKVFFKTRSNPEYQRLKLSTYNKDYSKNWRDDPAGMICKCAEAAALRSAFPTSLGGMYLQAEQHPAIEVSTTRPIFGQSAPSLPPAEPQKALPESAPQPQASPEPPKVTTPPAPAPAAPKPIANDKVESKANTIKRLCKSSGLKPVQVMDFLIAINSADEGTASFEELQLSRPEIVDLVIDQWPDISEKIKAS